MSAPLPPRLPAPTALFFPRAPPPGRAPPAGGEPELFVGRSWGRAPPLRPGAADRPFPARADSPRRPQPLSTTPGRRTGLARPGRWGPRSLRAGGSRRARGPVGAGGAERPRPSAGIGAHPVSRILPSSQSGSGRGLPEAGWEARPEVAGRTRGGRLGPTHLSEGDWVSFGGTWPASWATASPRATF